MLTDFEWLEQHEPEFDEYEFVERVSKKLEPTAEQVDSARIVALMEMRKDAMAGKCGTKLTI